MINLQQLFDQYKEQTLYGRYITLDSIEPLLNELNTHGQIEIIGNSVLGNPIYKYQIGEGKIKILLWSQMHGNESTTTKALFDFFNVIQGDSDFEKEYAHDTLYRYGLEDNFYPVKAFHVPWKELVTKLYEYIGASHFRFSSNVVKIRRTQDYFRIETEDTFYLCKKVIVATTIESLRHLFSNPIYREIEGQPFLRLYGKFSKKSLPILKEYIHGYTIVPGPLQKIIPMNEEKGVYMIAYNDNKNAKMLRPFLENTRENRDFFCELIVTYLTINCHC
jgi:hypothetical protein